MDLNRLTEQSQEALRRARAIALRREFKPEFLSRVDEIVVFHNLTRDHLKQIAEIQLRRLQERLAERHIVLRLSAEACDYLAGAGYDPNYGARPLKRVIQEEIETALGRLILKGEVKDGDEVIVEKSSGADELTFRVEPRNGPAGKAQKSSEATQSAA